MTTTDTSKPKPNPLPVQTVLAGLGIAIVAGLIGYQAGMRDVVLETVATTSTSSPSTQPAASSSPDPTSLEPEGDDVAACDAADKTVRKVVDRTDLQTDHHAADGAVALACRWNSGTYPPIAVSVIAGKDVGVDLVTILDETWTDTASMTNPRYYQQNITAVRAYLRNPQTGVETLVQIDGMLQASFPPDEPYVPVDIAADVRDALTK